MKKKKKVIQKPRYHEDWVKEQMKGPEFVKALKEPDEDPRIELAWQIQKLRKELNLSQAEFAKKVGIKQQQIARMESPKYGSTVDSLGKMAQACGKKLSIQFR